MSRKPMQIGLLELQEQRKEMPSSRNFGRPVFKKRNSFARFAAPRRRVRMCLPPKLWHVARPSLLSRQTQIALIGGCMRGTLRLPLLLLVPFLHSAKAPRDRFADSESCAEGDSSLAAGSANNHRRRATRTDCAIPLARL